MDSQADRSIQSDARLQASRALTTKTMNKLFAPIKDERTLRSENCSKAVKRAWRKRRAEGRTRHHPNQRLNYFGKDT